MLVNTMADEYPPRLVKDPIVCGKLLDFRGRSSNDSRKRYCNPGGKLGNITAACDDVKSNADPNTLFVVHAKANDEKTTTSSVEVLESINSINIINGKRMSVIS